MQQWLWQDDPSVWLYILALCKATIRLQLALIQPEMARDTMLAPASKESPSLLPLLLHGSGARSGLVCWMEQKCISGAMLCSEHVLSKSQLYGIARVFYMHLCIGLSFTIRADHGACSGLAASHGKLIYVKNVLLLKRNSLNWDFFHHCTAVYSAIIGSLLKAFISEACIEIVCAWISVWRHKFRSISSFHSLATLALWNLLKRGMLSLWRTSENGVLHLLQTKDEACRHK